MAEHVVLTGSSGVGKTSLMLEVARLDSRFYIERNWTYRAPGEDEGEDELHFVDKNTFESHRPHFLSTHRTHGPEYGVPYSMVIKGLEAPVSMRALPHDQVGIFRERMVGSIVVCAVAVSDEALVAERIRSRNRGAPPEETERRIAGIGPETEAAQAVADFTFYNDFATLPLAAVALHAELENR